MPITAKDIARELQLSQPTVSRVLNGDPNHRVSPLTRERVLEAAKRLGYQPNAVARSLRRGRTDIIGLYSNHDYDVRNEFHGTIVGALQRLAEQRGLDLLLHSGLTGRPAEEMYGKLRDGRVDGLILHANSDDPLVSILGSSSLPVVAVADALSVLPSVTADDVDGMRQLINYLWQRGYRRFCYVCPHVSLGSVERRRSTYESELRRRGVSDEDLMVLRINWETAVEPLQQIIESGKQTAICCWNDRTAYRLLEQCLARDVDVPSQLAIVGFDGFLADKVPARRLVTIRCPWERVASTALDMLMSLIDDKDRIEGTPKEIRLPVSLVDGDTA